MISASAGLWLVLCHRSSLLMIIGQRIRKILRRHELIKVCTFFLVTTVVLHVSEPYSRTGLTLLLKILILVWSVRSLELQTFFNCRKTALALSILALTSASVPPGYDYTNQIGKRIYLFEQVVIQPNWLSVRSVYLEDLGFPPAGWCGDQLGQTSP